MDVLSKKQVERARFVAANYELLQGLVVLPVLTVLLALALGDSDLLGEYPGWVTTVLIVVALPVSLVLGFAFNQYYRRRYGRVRPAGSRQGTWPILLLVGLLLLVALVHKMNLPVPVSPEGAIWGVAALATAWFQRPLAPPFLLIGTLVTLVSLAPLGLLTGTGHPLSDSETFILCLYVAWAVVAVWSHLLLRSTLGTIAGEDR